MRTLILTCNTGGGHNSCAKAIQQVFHKNGAVCDIADSLQFTSGRLSQFMSWGHTAMYRYIPGLFRWGYGFAEKHPDMLKEEGVAYKLISSGAEKLNVHIRKGGYDTIISTHVFAGLLLEQMQKEYPLNLKTAFVATDYTCSPGTAACRYDRYFIPHEKLIQEFIAQDVPGERIVVSGIPVSHDFHFRLDKEKAKERLGIDPSHSHLLMMCGSMGCGPMEELTKIFKEQMDASVELSIVCGTNEKLCQELKSIAAGNPRIHIYGYTDRMNDLMDSADLYLTKPGGLSITEAAAKRLPMVLIDAVAGCEKYNLDFFVSSGGAVTADSPEALADLCTALAKDEDRLSTMAERLSYIVEKPAAEAILSAMQDIK